MIKSCSHFEKGTCKFGNSCRLFHDKEKQASFANKKDKERKKVAECELFLEGKCKASQCTNYHNYSKIYLDQNNNEFANIFYTLSEDLNTLRPYETKILETLSLDLMLIMDCTATMGPWIQKVIEEIPNIKRSILESNPGCDIKVSFVGYRDHCDGEKRFEIHDFMSNMVELKKFIKKVDAFGGGDFPDDVAGGLDMGLKMNWTASTKYAVLISDAPCHGVKYHKGCVDSYPNGDPNGLVIENLIAAYGEKRINLFGIMINDSTDVMYQKISEKYKKVTSKDMHVENLGLLTKNLSHFISYSANITLGSFIQNKIKLEELIEEIRKEAMTLGDKNEEKRKELEDFFNRLSLLNQEANSKVANRRTMYYLPIGFVIPSSIQLPESWNLISKEYSCICFSWHIVKDSNSYIDWGKPQIRQSSIKSIVRVADTPFAKGKANLAFFMYDVKFDQKLVGKLPERTLLNEYNLTNLSYELENQIYFEYLANDFNDRIVNLIPDVKLLLQFNLSNIYKIKNGGTFRYLAAENLINGTYKKNSCTGQNNDCLNEASLIAQAFSHFTWQLTKGNLLITELQGVRGLLTDAQIHCLDLSKFGEGNLGYFGMMKFFMTHYCNKYCTQLKLIHPRKNLIIDEKFDFFIDKLERPPYNDIIFKLCDLCRKPFHTFTNTIFYKKADCHELCCKDCYDMLYSSTTNIVCSDCKTSFSSSQYRCLMKRMDLPTKCTKCRSRIFQKLEA